MAADGEAATAAKVELLWIPLGAGTGTGARIVRFSGGVFESLSAWRERRPRGDLYHSSLELAVPEGRFVIEVTPVPDARGRERGVVAEGAVGSRWIRRLRVFRYEIRRWRDGVTPDAEEAVARLQVTDDLDRARRILALVPAAPTPVWGRDELRAGEMWNSNSLISWLLDRSGVDTEEIRLPPKGRAPGWNSGRIVARRGRP